MEWVKWEGQRYRDDRMFVLHIARCTKQDIDGGLVETTIHHEDIPEHAMWCLATYRNTERYPLIRVDHFGTRAAALDYAQEVEPTVPLISRGGLPLNPPLHFSDWTQWKEAQGWKDYDYRSMYSPGGQSAREVAIAPRT